MIKAQATIVLTTDDKGRLDIRTNGDVDLCPMVDALLEFISTLVKPSTVVNLCERPVEHVIVVHQPRAMIYGDIKH